MQDRSTTQEYAGCQLWFMQLLARGLGISIVKRCRTSSPEKRKWIPIEKRHWISPLKRHWISPVKRHWMSIGKGIGARLSRGAKWALLWIKRHWISPCVGLVRGERQPHTNRIISPTSHKWTKENADAWAPISLSTHLTGLWASWLSWRRWSQGDRNRRTDNCVERY